ncbi:MAG TPA: hypothetical protein VLE02_01685 [Nitrosarchaeum sp.]|nr:hypothetical protein [Nitrosarchaeum sp.]
MFSPIRCFSCGKIIQRPLYEKLLKEGHAEHIVLNKMDVKKVCCRRAYLTHNPEIEDNLLLYSEEVIAMKERSAKLTE